MQQQQIMQQHNKLVLALAKGRILRESLPLLAQTGIEPLESIDASRKLIFPTSHPHIDIIVVRATDVPVYVGHCAADLGVVGKDTLLEYAGENFYDMLDLKISPCKLIVAGLADNSDINRSDVNRTMQGSVRRLTIATKYVKTTKKYFAAKNKNVDMVKLYGSMELAPLTGLADYIVDIMDTGNTLQQNGLVPLATIMPITSRMIVSKTALKTKHQLINPLLEHLQTIISACT